jgi:aldehyde:ferredoxin oxidoreductase
MENALTAFDAIGGCKFMGILLTAEEIVTLISNATGWEFGVDDFRQGGERTYNLARAFCVREGMDREQDTLPDRLMEDPLPEGPAEGMVNESEAIEMMKDAYYQIRGWDKTTGIPTPEKLQELALDDLIQDLWD